MKGDFTRFTFDPKKHYNRVLMQQGRVQLDADWNEQAHIQAHLRQTEAKDVIGRCGAPVAHDGFKINFIDNQVIPDLAIYPGRIYVDGILCELEATTPLEVSFTGVGEAEVLSLTMDGRTFEVGDCVEIFVEDDTANSQLLQIVEINPENMILTFNVPINDDLLRAVEPKLRRITTYKTQADYPVDKDADIEVPALVYLDVWERHITSIDDPKIREVALGGPDTTTRARAVSQVKLLPLSLGQCEDININEFRNFSCSQEFSEWRDLVKERNARIAAQVNNTSTESSSPCDVSPGSHYIGLENQLYRVEVHNPGTIGEATFKWSRDNGSVVRAIKKIEDNKITFENSGQDVLEVFAQGQWVEITDEWHDLRELPGILVQVISVDGFTLTFDPTKVEGDVEIIEENFPLERKPKMRRWDHRTEQASVSISSTEWINLENDIQVAFHEGDEYKTGDFWLIPARAATGKIEWPLKDGQGLGHVHVQEPEYVQRLGIEHHYCHLAILTLGHAGDEVLVDDEVPVRDDASIWDSKDCRKLFPPLANMITLSYVSGDGQESMPGNMLPKPLQVSVFRGGYPVENAQVKFEIVNNKQGSLKKNRTVDDAGTSPSDSNMSLTVSTGTDGIAQCVCQIHENLQVKAVLLYPEQVISSPIRFNANVSVAELVAYEPPEECPQLEGSETVKEAIDGLCRQVSFSYVGGDGQEAMPGHELNHPLQVGVSNGKWPVANAPVTFEVVKGGGSLATDASSEVEEGDGTLVIDARTGNDGMACCRWTLGVSGTQCVKATLKDAEDSIQLGLPIYFNANVSTADKVHYSPPECYELDVSNATNVQAAIDRLCQIQQSGKSCAITVGVGGQYEQLDVAVARLIEEGRRDICICLLPGDHNLTNFNIIGEISDASEMSELSEAPMNVKIAGCGAGTRINLQEYLWMERLGSVTLKDLTIKGPLIFKSCEEVRIKYCHLGLIDDVESVENPVQFENWGYYRCIKSASNKYFTGYSDVEVPGTSRPSLLYDESNAKGLERDKCSTVLVDNNDLKNIKKGYNLQLKEDHHLNIKETKLGYECGIVDAPNGAQYRTEAQRKRFEFGDWGEYWAIGFLGVEYFAAYTKGYLHEKSEDSNLMQTEHLSRVLINEDNIKVLSSTPLELKEGYELAIIQKDNMKVTVKLGRDGEKVETRTLDLSDPEKSTYTYVTDLKCDAKNIVVIAVHLKYKDILHIGTVIAVDGIWQISKDPICVKKGSKFGVMAIDTVDSKNMLIDIRNKEKIRLDKNEDLLLMGDIRIKTANQDLMSSIFPLRYYVYKQKTIGEDELGMRLKGEMARVIDGKMKWNVSNFSGFYHDMDKNIGNERIVMNIVDGAIEEDGGIGYGSEAQKKSFKFGDWGEYWAIGFMGEEHFAAYDVKGRDLYGESNDTNLMERSYLSKVLIDYHRKNDESLPQLEEGYKLTIKRMNGNKIKVILNNDNYGNHVKALDEKELDISEGSTYTYAPEIPCGEKKVKIVIIAVHFKEALLGVTIDGIWQISDEPISVEKGTKYGEMIVDTVGSEKMLIEMRNEEKIILDKNEDIRLIGNIGIKTANQKEINDDNPLRFYIYKEITNPGAYEIRGNISEIFDGETVECDTSNFAGFYHDLDNDVGTELLTFEISAKDVVKVDLLKGGGVLDSSEVFPFSKTPLENTYLYKMDVGAAENIVTIAVHFSDVKANLAVVDGVWQISETPLAGSALLEISDARHILLENNVLESYDARSFEAHKRIFDADETLVKIFKELFPTADRLSFTRKAQKVAKRLIVMGLDGCLELADVLDESLNATCESGELSDVEIKSHEKFQETIITKNVTLDMIVTDLVDIFDAAAESHPRNALILADGKGDTTIVDNQIFGVLSLYGRSPETADLEQNVLENISSRLNGDVTSFGDVQTALHLRGNRLTQMRVGDGIIKLLLRVKNSVMRDVFGSIFHVDNILMMGHNQWVAREVRFTNNCFDLSPFEEADIGWSTSETAIYMGNSINNADIVLLNISKICEQVANPNMIIKIFKYM